MERPRKREHHTQLGESKGSPKRARHKGSTIQNELPLTKPMATAKHQGYNSHEHLPKEIALHRLSVDTDFVHRWLTQTINDVNENQGPQKAQGRSRTSTQDQRAGPMHIDHESQQKGIDRADVKLKRKGGHKASSDSSLLEVSRRPQSQPAIRQDSKTDLPQRPESSAPLRKKSKMQCSDSEFTGASATDISPRLPPEIFEKKARHKTREDRYNLDREAKSRSGKGKNPKKWREKKPKWERMAKKAGEDLINNFSSKSVGQDRLTIRPSHSLGIFINGRASSPVGRRGVPNLAFSEMEFLQHSSHHMPAIQIDKVSSKSREIERRKITRAREEVSTFFRPNKLKMQEEGLSIDRSKSLTPTKDRDPTYGRRIESVQLAPTCERSPSQDTYGRSYFDVDSRPKRNNVRAMAPAIAHDKHICESSSRLYGQARSLVSWSETQISPDSKLSYPTIGGPKLTSSTPESIRKSLQKTGIFRHTGISTNSESRDLESRVSPRTNTAYAVIGCLEMRPNRDVLEDSTVSWETWTTEASQTLLKLDSDSRTEVPRFKLPFSDKNPSSRENSEESHRIDGVENQRGQEQKIKTTSKIRGDLMFKYYDPVSSRWHEQPNFEAAVMTKSIQAHEPDSPPILREQVAKKARMRLPQANIPVSIQKDEGSLPGEGNLKTTKVALQNEVVTNLESHLPTGSKASKESVNGQFAKIISNSRISPDFSLEEESNFQNRDFFNSSSLTGEGIHVFRPASSAFVLQNLLHTEDTLSHRPPMRGAWTRHGPVQIASTSTFSPSYYRETLFSHQELPEPRPNEYFHYEHELGSSGTFENFASLNMTAVHAVNDYSKGLLEENNTADDLQFDTYDSQEFQQLDRDEEYHDGYSEADLLDSHSYDYGGGPVDYEIVDMDDQREDEQGHIREDLHYQHECYQSDRPLEQDDEYKLYNVEEDHHIRRFWRPYRQY